MRPGRDPRDELPAAAAAHRRDGHGGLEARHGAAGHGAQRRSISARSWTSASTRTGWCTSRRSATASCATPSEAVQVGDVVRVRVLSVDEKEKADLAHDARPLPAVRQKRTKNPPVTGRPCRGDSAFRRGWAGSGRGPGGKILFPLYQNGKRLSRRGSPSDRAGKRGGCKRYPARRGTGTR